MGQLVLNLDVACHMLADIDQIVTEMEMDYNQFSREEWIQKLRVAVDGDNYKTLDDADCTDCDGKH